MDPLDEQIEQWRSAIGERAGSDRDDLDDLERRLREQASVLAAGGLTLDEAFLLAIRRIGTRHPGSLRYGRRLWDQSFVDGEGDPGGEGLRGLQVLGLAVPAAVTVVVARLAAGWPGEEAPWVWRNGALLVLPFLAGYLAVRSRLDRRRWIVLAVPFALGGLALNGYPFVEGSSTELLAAGHLAPALWAAIAYAHGGGSWRSHERRRRFVRFSGEWAVILALLALGGAVLMALTAGVLGVAGIDAEPVVQTVIPSGAAGAVIVAAWLAESRQHSFEAIAPALSSVYTPLFAVMVVASAVLYAATGLQAGFDRDAVALFDLLLVTVVGLVLYGSAARRPGEGPGWMDVLRLVTMTGAILLDAIVLVAMVGRIGELGFTPNRLAAFGLNLLLLVDLAGTAWWSVRFLTGRSGHDRVERWQLACLPLLACWAAAVVVVVPVVFRFA